MSITANRVGPRIHPPSVSSCYLCAGGVFAAVGCVVPFDACSESNSRSSPEFVTTRSSYNYPSLHDLSHCLLTAAPCVPFAHIAGGGL